MNKCGKGVALTGESGFVGTRLSQRLITKGWKVIALKRSFFQNDSTELIEAIDGVDAVINLAGAPIIGRWTPQYKKVLWASRVDLTRKLVSAIGQAQEPPKTLISTSAVGYYADEGHHTESDYRKADTFLGQLTSAWEAEAIAAQRVGVRTVIFRLGVVLGSDGGALVKMLPAFRLGLGGVIGDGSQALSWVHIDDLVQAYLLAHEDDSLKGIYNLTAPNPGTNKELTRELGSLLSRPTFLPLPTWFLRLLLGEGAQVLTKGQHVEPQRLMEAGFSFQYSQIREALKNCIAFEG